MRNIFIISFLLLFITGCNFNSKKQEEIRNLHIQDSLKIVHQQDSIRKVKLELEQQLIQDSINRELEKIAISDIAFGINQKTYKTKEKNFLKSCKHEKYDLYYLGEFRFNMKGIFNENDSLYCVILEGNNESITDYGKQQVRLDYKVLYSILYEKYSSPNVNYGIPTMDDESPFMWDNSTSDSYGKYGETSYRTYHYCECAKWEIGEKNIEIRLMWHYKAWIAVALVIYRKDMASKVDMENHNLFLLEQQKEEQKKNESTKKALDVI